MMTCSHSRGGGTSVASTFASMRSIREARSFMSAFPPVERDDADYKGRQRPKPHFRVLEWRPGKDGGSPPPPPNAALPTPARAELDDEIPF
jgi:hypothetical protein